MPQIDKFDRVQTGLLMEEVGRKLEQVCLEYGIAYKMRRWTFDNQGNWVRGGFELHVRDESGEVKGPERSCFNVVCHRYKLLPEDLDKEFEWYDGTKWRISGINSRAKKYPICAVRVDDPSKRCRFPADSVRSRLGRVKVARDLRRGARAGHPILGGLDV